MRRLRRMLAAGLLLAAAGAVPAQEAPPEFASAAEQQRYETLLRELRCLVCQNQTLAESNAPLALDLRTEVLRLVQSGASREQIVEFLVARYGDFVLYRPPLKPSTWALWFAPPLLLLGALLLILRIVRARPRPEPAPLTAEERARLDALLPRTDPPP